MNVNGDIRELSQFTDRELREGVVALTDLEAEQLQKIERRERFDELAKLRRDVFKLQRLQP